MPALAPYAANLASSESGRWLVWSEAGRLRVRDGGVPPQLAELAVTLDAPFDLAVSSGDADRLLIVQGSAGNTQVRVFALPELREVTGSPLSLRGDARLAAICGSVAVLRGGTESLTIVDLARLRTSPLPARGPIQVVATWSAEQVLVGARGKLEVWSVTERRPTHRLGVALPGDATFGGVVAGGRMLWLASSGAPGRTSLFRLSDGKLVASHAAGGAIKAITADPSSTTAVAAIHASDAEPVQLIALDLESHAQRDLVFDPPLAAFCLAGAPPDAVAVLADHGPPVLVALAMGTTTAVPRSHRIAGVARLAPAPVADEPAADDVPRAQPVVAALAPPPEVDERADLPPPVAPDDLATRLSQWRAQVQAAVVAAPPRLVPASGRGAPASDEPRSRSRTELYAWGQSARARATTTPPPPPAVWRLTDLALRFQIDTRSRTLLALLYASWLDGEAETGVPVGAVARALGNDEAAWIEALAQGRLGRMAWLTCRRGRTRLRGAVGRFLDEAPPHVTVVAPDGESAAALAPPLGPARWIVPDAAAFVPHARALANRLSAPVAVIDLAALPAARRARMLASRVFEARLHGALPIVLPCDAAGIEPAELDGPWLVAVTGSPDPAWRALPVWPEIAAADATADARAAPPTGEPH